MQHPNSFSDSVFQEESIFPAEQDFQSRTRWQQICNPFREQHLYLLPDTAALTFGRTPYFGTTGGAGKSLSYMIHRHIINLVVTFLLLYGSRVLAQPGSTNFNKVWVQGQSYVFSTEFQGSGVPDNQILLAPPPDRFFSIGNSNICDSNGNLLLVSDGFNLYNSNIQLIDNGARLAPDRIYNFNDGWSLYSQSSILLPFENGIYRLVTPSVSDDSCARNWENIGTGAIYDLLLYDDVDMKANGGAGRVTQRMVPLLDGVRLSKSQMMACRHGDGKSWWLFKHASDTNLIYKFLFTQNKVYGPYIQGFSGVASHFGLSDHLGQSKFSADGTKYASTIIGYGKVFVADFDRCTGMLSNPKVYKVPPQTKHSGSPELDSTTGGLSISPNGRYLYVTGSFNVQQLDLLSANPASSWTHLSGADTTTGIFQWYSNIYPGPDGKLYIGNWHGFSGQMSVINTPDSGGAAANFCRKCLRFPGFMLDTTFMFAGVAAPPCMPNYALGATTPICYPTSTHPIPTTENQLRLYPNPSHGVVEVQAGEAGEMKFFDLQGRNVQSVKLTNSRHSDKVSLTLAAGMYLYRFYNQKGEVAEGRLIVHPH